MSKIQIEASSCSSAATHHLTQPSSTLNRRYVRRPMNIAIEEAARAAQRQAATPASSSTPSRLVNLGVSSADLEAAKKREQAEAARVAAAKAAEAAKKAAADHDDTNTSTTVALIPNVVEFGQASTETNNYTPECQTNNTSSVSAPMALTPNMSTPTPEPIYPATPVSGQSVVEMGTAPMSSNNNYMYAGQTYNTASATMPTVSEASNSQNNYPANYPTPYESQPEVQSPAPTATPPAEIDTTALAMNIAADYATASLSASIKEYGDGYQGYAISNPENLNAENSPADAIAQAASAAIASIRTATEPDQVSEQIASLQAFADNIKNNHDTPEMRELGDTINKFIGIAKKSTKVQEEAKQNNAKAKVSLSSKANRAADKVTKSSAKVMAVNNRNRAKGVTKTPASLNAKNAGVKPPVRRSGSLSGMSRMPAHRMSASEVRANAMEHALESAATMDQKSRKSRSRTAMRPRRKTGIKRFAIAFTCAAACVAGLITFVSSNMPDISVRVAAMQTGIQAAYPSYIPRDYALGDIFSEDGKISMIFEGPAGSSFTLVQEKSSWDSSALLRNYVEPKWGQEYTTTHEQGITIYISNANADAAWVNGGVLYKINSEGTALTKKQVRSIVTSL